MVNKIVATTLGVHGLFLATGCLSLAFSLIVRNLMDMDPNNGEEATRNLLYKEFPLTAGIANGALIIVAFVASLPGLLMPMRGWLKASGYMITLCGLFTLCIGVYLWVMTLNIRDSFFDTYLDQEPAVHDLIQTRVSRPYTGHCREDVNGWKAHSDMLNSSNAAATSTAPFPLSLRIRHAPVPPLPVWYAAARRQFRVSLTTFSTSSSLPSSAALVSNPFASQFELWKLR